MGELMDSVMRAGPDTHELRVGPDAVLAWTTRPLALEHHDWPKGWPGGPPPRGVPLRITETRTEWMPSVVHAHVLWRRGTLEGVEDVDAAETIRARMLAEGIDGVPVVPGTAFFNGDGWVPLTGRKYSRVDWLRRHASFRMAGPAHMDGPWPAWAESYAALRADPFGATPPGGQVRWNWGWQRAELSDWLREQPVIRAAWLEIIERLGDGPGTQPELAARFGVVDP